MSSQGKERAQFEYLLWNDDYNHEKPYQVFVDLPDGTPDKMQSNLAFQLGEEQEISDIRTCAPDAFSLDQNGFALVGHETRVTDWDDIGQLEDVYLHEIQDLMRDSIPDVHHVVIFDWRIRKASNIEAGEHVNMDNRLLALQPARQVHIDQTPWSAVKRTSIHAPEMQHYFANNRVRIVNAWRPIISQVEDWPLAVCDARSVEHEELIAVDSVRRRYVGESYYVTYNHAHRWFYVSQQKRDEVLLITNYDSGNVSGKYCPHASFKHASIPENAEARASIEVRALIFSDS